MKTFLVPFVIFIVFMLVTYGGIHFLFPNPPVNQYVLAISCFLVSGTTAAVIPHLWAVFIQDE